MAKKVKPRILRIEIVRNYYGTDFEVYINGNRASTERELDILDIFGFELLDKEIR